MGGMAEVFKAKSFGVEGFEKILAIKRILPSMAEDAEFVEMFIDEAKIAGQLSHANICQIFELGRIADSHFIAMEFVWGRDILQIQNRFRRLKQPMPVAMACFVAAKVCEGLDYAHKRKDSQGRALGIIHRDVSPQNILVSFEGEVKIIDFGIAKAVGRSSKTQAGVLKGKFGYMSPEQVRGLPIDHRSDVFAVGTILHEMLAGDRLFAGDSDFATLEKVRNVDIKVPSIFNHAVPTLLDDIVMKTLSRDPEDRFGWASELQEQLQGFLTQQEPVFTSKDLARWMKETFAEELAREQAQLEQYKRVGRDGRLSPPAAPSQSGSKSGRMPAASPSGRFQAIPEPRRSPPPPTPRPDRPPPAGEFGESDATLIGGPLAFSGDGDGPPETTEETNKERLRGLAAGPLEVDDPGANLLDDEDTSGRAQLGGRLGPEEETRAEFSSVPRGIRASPEAMTLGPPQRLRERDATTPPPIPPADRPGPSVIYEAPDAPKVDTTADLGEAARKARPRGRTGGLWKDLGMGAVFFVLVVAGALLVRSVVKKGDGKGKPKSMLVVATTPPREGDVIAQPVGGKPGSEVKGHIASAEGAKIQLQGLEPGAWRVELHVEGLAPLSNTVELKPGEPEVMIFQLPAAEPKGASLRLEVQPQGATILLDGAEIAANRVVPVAPGAHELRVTKPGYKEVRERLQFTPGSEEKRSLTLQVGRAVIDLASEPSGAEILLDGRSVGTTPFVLDDLEFGKSYKITLKTADHKETRMVTPRLDEPRRSMLVTLGKPEGAGDKKPKDGAEGKTDEPARDGKTGYLIANTQPWARVVIDGKDTGRSTPIPPISKIALREGKHQITFVVGKGDRAQRFEFDVNIKGGEDYRLIRKLATD